MAQSSIYNHDSATILLTVVNSTYQMKSLLNTCLDEQWKATMNSSTSTISTSSGPEDQVPRLPDGYSINKDEEDIFDITREQYLAGRDAKVCGTTNPSIMENAFWKHMIHSTIRGFSKNAWRARNVFVYGDLKDPVWCFERYGQTRTQ